EVRIEVTQSIATRRGTPRPITAIRALEHAPRPLGAAPVDVGDAHGRGQAEVVKLTVGEHWTGMTRDTPFAEEGAQSSERGRREVSTATRIATTQGRDEMVERCGWEREADEVVLEREPHVDEDLLVCVRARRPRAIHRLVGFAVMIADPCRDLCG